MKTRSTTVLLCMLIILAPRAFAQEMRQQELAERSLQLMERHMPGLLEMKAAEFRLQRALIQTWAETDWENQSETRYSYSGGLQTESVTRTWEEGEWVNSDRTQTTFSGGLVVTQQFEEWTGTEWAPVSRSTFSYNGGNATEMVVQVWTGTDWQNQSRTTYDYSGGAITAWQSEEWDGSEWVPTERATIEESGGDVVQVLQEWDGSAWVNTDRTIFAGITIAELNEIFEEFAETADASLAFTLLFTLPDFLEQVWIDGEWVDSARQITERDAQDRPVTILFEDWVEGEWEGDFRQALTYDDEGRVATLEWQGLEDEEWVSFFVFTYTYNEDDLPITIVQHVDIGIGILFTQRIILEWTDVATAIEDETLPATFALEHVYPNPFNPTANVTFSLAAPAQVTVRVHDALGRHVATLVEGVRGAGRHQVAFDASDLPSGMYLIRMETPQGVQTRTVSLIR